MPCVVLILQSVFVLKKNNVYKNKSLYNAKHATDSSELAWMKSIDMIKLVKYRIPIIHFYNWFSVHWLILYVLYKYRKFLLNQLINANIIKSVVSIKNVFYLLFKNVNGVLILN